MDTSSHYIYTECKERTIRTSSTYQILCGSAHNVDVQNTDLSAEIYGRMSIGSILLIICCHGRIKQVIVESTVSGKDPASFRVLFQSLACKGSGWQHAMILRLCIRALTCHSRPCTQFRQHTRRATTCLHGPTFPVWSPQSTDGLSQQLTNPPDALQSERSSGSASSMRMKKDNTTTI